MKQRKVKISSVCINVIIVLLILITLFPIYLMIATSTKTETQMYANFWGIQFPVTWSNYTDAFNIVKSYIKNSIIVTFFILLYIVILSVLGGYAFARLRFRGKKLLFWILMSLQMIPASLMLVPKYLLICNYGMADSYIGVILPYAAASVIFPLILSRSFFMGMPNAVFEAARIDGAGELSIIKNIVIPLSKPIIGSVTLMTFFGAFNDYMWPMLVLSSDSLKTIPVGLKQLVGAYGTNYGFQMAAYSIVTVPLLILITCTMRVYVKGITLGAVKE